MATVPDGALVSNASALAYLKSMSRELLTENCREMLVGRNPGFQRLLIMAFGNKEILPYVIGLERETGRRIVLPDIFAAVLKAKLSRYDLLWAGPGGNVYVNGMWFGLDVTPLDEKLKELAEVVHKSVGLEKSREWLLRFGVVSGEYKYIHGIQLAERLVRDLAVSGVLVPFVIWCANYSA